MRKNTTKTTEIQEFEAKLAEQQQADLNNHNNSMEKLQARLTQENKLKLSWNDNQVSYFLDKEPPDITGLCKGKGWTFPQGETTLLVAQGGTGKSYFLLGLMLAFASGIKYGEFDPKKRYRVLGLFGEDCEAVLHNRTRNIIKTLGLDNEEYLYYLNKNFNALSVINMRLVEYGQFQNPTITDNYNLLRDFLAKEESKKQPIDVLIIDPLIRFYGLNENINGEASYFVDTVLGSLQREFGITTILAHHIPKGDKIKTIQDIEQISPRGASAFLDNSRFTVAMMNVSKKEAKDCGIQEQDYKNYVAIKPIKTNYTSGVAKPSFLRRFDYGVLLPSNPEKDLNINIETELYSCLNDYYNKDEISYSIETRGKLKTDSADLKQMEERKKLCIRDLTKKDGKDKTINHVVDIIHARLRNIGLKKLTDIGLRIIALAERKRLKIENVKGSNKQEIVLL